MASIGTRQHLSAALGRLVRVWLPACGPDPAGRGQHGPASGGGSRGRSPRAGTVSTAVAAALVVAVAGPALAVDATGTWSGKSTCWQRGRARVTRTERHGTMLISQRGGALFVEIDGTVYRGDSHDSNRDGTRARGTAARCTQGAEALAVPMEVLTLKMKVDEARGTTRINAESTVQNARDGRRCRYRYSRISREDPGIGLPPPAEVCGDGIVNDAPNEDCDGAATGTPCDGACAADCTCPTACQRLDVSGHWDGRWVSEVTGESGPVVADLSHEGEFVFGAISFPPFGDENYSPPFLQMSPCAPAEFSSGAILPSGVAGLLGGSATNTSLAGTWMMSDGSDHGTWRLSR